MLAPLSWLKQYVSIDMAPEEFARRMIMNGNAVEEVENLAAEVENVVVGKVLSVAPHANSDHLHICQVDVGQGEPIQIVTGADNMAAGDFVPVALHDSHLPGGVHIKRGKLRGEVSNGMMCSGEELGVPADVYPSNVEHGLLILREKDLVPGQDIRPVLGLDDAVLNFEILANRPDCLSMLGLAHEAAVVTGGAVQEPACDVAPAGEGTVEDLVDVSVEAPDLCRRYCAAAIRNIHIAPSPLWMRQALHKAGVRPINNVVDITNYVMLEMGQPMHAFDLDQVRGRKILVRRAKDGETIQTLDGKDRELTQNMLVIADAEGATGLAGIMGGQESEITENTKLVLFESACFDSACTRQAGRSLGMHTEAQGRFERGVNERLCRKALERALHLMQELGAGEVVPGVIDIYPEEKPLPVVRAKADYLYTLMGVEVPMETMQEILTGLGIATRVEGDELVCTSPVWRQDIVRGADIAEEVLRIYGYDHIPSTKMRKAESGRNSEHQTRDAIVRKLLCGMGAYEAATFSFIGPKWLDALRLPEDSPLRLAARLQNPLGEENSLMRTTLVPSMLNVLATAMLPLIACAVVVSGLRRRLDLFSCFTEGAKKGMGSILQLIPTLVALMVGVEMLSASGIFTLFAELLAPVAHLLGLPEQLTPLILMRPLSGSGSMSVLQQIISSEGVDSLIATAGAVILTSTETTLYTTGIYFGSVGVSNTRCTIPAALLADCTAVLCGSLLVRLLLFS